VITSTDPLRPVIGVGMPAWIKLLQFGQELRDYFGAVPYLVGSAARRKETRDVDVRLILPDEEFDALIGEREAAHYFNAKWSAACLAWSARGRELTGLQIDFQIQRQTEANEKYGDEPRYPLIVLRAAK
jgi:hypothetical protein